MDKHNGQFIDLNKIKNIKSAFEESMKLLEKGLAESITNKKKLDIMKKDMLAANRKISEAEECLISLKNKIHDS